MIAMPMEFSTALNKNHDKNAPTKILFSRFYHVTRVLCLLTADAYLAV